MSVAKVSAALYAFFGLIFGVIMTVIALSATGTSEVGAFGAVFGAGAMIFLPIVYGIMGFIGGFIFALVFNLITPRAGGITIEVEEAEIGEAN